METRISRVNGSRENSTYVLASGQVVLHPSMHVLFTLAPRDGVSSPA